MNFNITESGTVPRNYATSLPEIKLKGYIGDRLDKMIENHVTGTDVDYITAVFLEKTESRGWWQTEFWGKYMHSAVPYTYYRKNEKLETAIRRSVERILSSQEESGYIGNYPDECRCGEGWDVWGMKYTMLGLLHYYDWVREKGEKDEAAKIISACRRLCDYVIAELGPGGKRGYELWTSGNWSGFASCSILEPVVWLYKRTNEKKYLDFAEYIVDCMEKPEAGPRLIDLALRGISVADRNGYGNKPEIDGSYVGKHNRWKAYEMMSCYQGILEYYEVMVEKEGHTERLDRLYKATLMTGEDIIKTEINLAGGCASSEAWYHGAVKQHLPYVHLQETCVTTTWMRFCEKLYEMTDDPKWIDYIERAFYNVYLAAMHKDGGEFTPYVPLTGDRYHGMHHCFMHTDCCTANGPRGFLCFLREFFKNDGKTATVNFYASAILPGFEMYSLYPRNEYARIVSHTEGQLKLRLRVPGWGKNTQVFLNGDKAGDGTPGTYFELDHVWKLGDIVEIFFDMPVIVHKIDHHVAFTRGPVLLARDSRLGEGDLTEQFRRGINDGDTIPSVNAVRVPSDDFWMAFTATLQIGAQTQNPEGRLPETVTFCDFASAGNSWKHDNYYRTWFPVEYGPEE